MNSSLRILHLEDDLNDAELVRAALEEAGYRLDAACVETKADFMAALTEKEYDIILADYRLPSFDGLSALAIARVKTPDVPFIFVSGVMGEELAIDTLKNGATDYVLKQRLSRLAPAVRRALKEEKELIKRKRAEEELKKYHEQLEELVRERTAELSSTIEQLKHEISERRRAEKEREKTEEQFRLLVEGVKDYAIFMIDPAGRVLSWNEGAERIKGYRADEIIGRHFSSFYTEEDVKQGKPANHLQIADEQGSYEEDSLKVRKDGSQFWANIVITALRDEAGRLRGFSKVIRDISERRQAEEKLLASRLQLEESWARYVYLYDHAPVGYYTFDGKGRIIAVNLTGSRQQGLAKDAMLKRPFSSFMSRDDGDLFYLHLKKVFATGGRQCCTLTLFQENGKPFHAQLDSIPSIIVSGENPLCQTTVTDITERKELEEALQVSETFFRRLFEEAREGILILDAETGQISDVNPFLMEMLGYSHEDFLGRKLWEIGLLKDVEEWRVLFAELQSKGFVRYSNLPLETKNGRITAVEFISSVFLVNHRKMIQCRIRDVTRRELGSGFPPQEHNGTERCVRERRTEQRTSNAELEQERKRKLQLEESLRKALAENKTLKDRLVIENIYFHQESKKKQQFDHIIGQSDGLKYVLYRAEQVAPIDTTVLILGETGTGKELIAEIIHNLSPRKDRPLITVNCAALPANLIESELFGREKGAFTGADTRQMGRFEMANGSTLCLDEIGELPMEMQAKLLRVIQHGVFERLGSSMSIKVDVRIVATTNRNLEEAIRIGGFREDLFYRLNVFPITVPPLRQRIEDIPLLVQAFVERYARKMGKQITAIPKETMTALQNYPWPGNIRELESIIERAVILCRGPILQLADKLNISPPPLSSSGGTMKEMERSQILQALEKNGWRIEGKDGAAQLLGLHPSTLRARMHKLGIVRPDSG